MRKNFAKGEKMIDRVVAEAQREKLIKEAEEADRRKLEETGEDPSKVNNVVELLQKIKGELSALSFRDKTVYQKVGITEEKIKKLLENPEGMTPDDWQIIKKVKQEIEKQKNRAAKRKKTTDEDLVQDARKDVILKRDNINVKKGWVPM